MRRLWILGILSAILISACSSGGGAEEVFSGGDAARGETLFSQSIDGAPACSNCHRLEGDVLLAPNLSGLGSVAASRVSGQSAADYLHTSIVRPAAYLVSGFGNLMYNQYSRRLTPQQIADLIAFLLTL